jgi:hypothetical protein
MVVGNEAEGYAGTLDYLLRSPLIAAALAAYFDTCRTPPPCSRRHQDGRRAGRQGRLPRGRAADGRVPQGEGRVAAGRHEGAHARHVLDRGRPAPAAGGLPADPGRVPTTPCSRVPHVKRNAEWTSGLSKRSSAPPSPFPPPPKRGPPDAHPRPPAPHAAARRDPHRPRRRHRPAREDGKPVHPPGQAQAFRFTSPSREILTEVAALYGGEVKPWTPANGGPVRVRGVLHQANRLPVLIPPRDAVSQWYELYAGSKCQRRCDGQTEQKSDRPCMCNPEKRECAITTRVNVMLRDVPALGQWLLVSKGYYAAVNCRLRPSCWRRPAGTSPGGSAWRRSSSSGTRARPGSWCRPSMWRSPRPR